MHIHIHLPHYSSRLQQDEKHVQLLQSCLHSNKHPASTEALQQNTGEGNSRARGHLEGLRTHSGSVLLSPSTTCLVSVQELCAWCAHGTERDWASEHRGANRAKL